MKIRYLLLGASLLLSGAAYAASSNTLWDSRLGDTQTIDNMAIGQNTSAPGRFTPLAVDSGTKTATASSGAATLNKNAGAITSESLTTAAAADYVLTLTDSAIAATDQVLASVRLGSSTTGEPAITSVTPAAGSVVINVRNIAASAAFNGTIIISFVRFAN